MGSRYQRRRRLARQKWERQQQRRVERARRRRGHGVVTGAVLAVVAVIGVGVWVGSALWPDPADAPAAANDRPTPMATSSPQPAPDPTIAGECVYVKEKGKDRASVGLPPTTVNATDRTKAFTIRTDHGPIKGRLFAKQAPCAVNSFEYLAGQDAFANTVCTELATKPAPVRYLACGDLTGSGAGGPGYVFADENKPDRKSYEPGLLVLAGGEDRNGSRFLLTYGDAQTLEGVGTVFGKVDRGLDIVEEVAKAGISGRAVTKGIGRPAEPLVVESIGVESTTTGHK